MKKIIFALFLFLSFTELVFTQNICSLDPELQHFMKQKSGELVSVNIILRSQIDVDKLESKRQVYRNKEAKKEAVLKEFKKFSEANQSEVLSFLNAETRSNRVSDIKCHWITNMINCKVESSFIYELAQHPDIAAISYNKKEYMLFNEKPIKAEPVRGKVENITKINADDVWSYGYTGKGVVVAVLDTGTNIDHVDLKDHLWDGGSEYPNHGYNIVEENHDVTDFNGHGTHCAGTICGDGTSGTQTGMAPDAILMTVKIFDSEGNGNVNDIISGVEFAVENGADVLSLSLGASFPDMYTNTLYRRTFENLLELDILAVVAAGNDRDKLDEFPIPKNINSPGNCPPAWLHPDQRANAGGRSSVITIGAVDYNDAPASFSSEGPVTWMGSEWNDYILDVSVEVDPGWLCYDNGMFEANIGGSEELSWAVMFPPSKLKGCENGELTKISMYNRVAHDGDIEIYQGGDTPNDATLIHTQSYSCYGENGFVEFMLTTPLSISTSENLWIVMRTNDGEEYPATACAVTADPNGRWLGTSDASGGTYWYNLSETDMNYTWMLRAFVTNYSGSITTLSNDNEFGLIRPDISAPGVDILSCDFSSNNGFLYMSGTSMATPCVAGAVALMLEKNPDVTPAFICEALETTAKKLTDKKDNRTGSGRIDIMAAIDFISEESKPLLVMQQSSPKEITTGKNVDLEVTMTNEGTAPTEDMTLRLESNSQYVDIITKTANFGVLNPGEKKTASFTVKADAKTPDNHAISFTLRDNSKAAVTSNITYTFEENANGWTTIDANKDKHTWYHSSQASEHSSQTDENCMLSESYCNASKQAFKPNDYLVSPVKFNVSKETAFEFYTRLQDNKYPEYIGLAVSTTGNSSESDFTTVYEWEISETKSVREVSGWYICRGSLEKYEGKEVWLALRHFNSEDQFVIAVDDFKVSNYLKYDADDWTSTFSVKVNNECHAATDLKAEALSNSSIKLTWEASSTANEYQVLRDNVKIYTTKGTSYTDENLKSGTKYCYTVKSVCNMGLSDASNEACATTSKITVDAPENLEAKANSGSTIELTWDEVDDAENYNIYQDGNFINETDENYYLAKDLDADTKYCFTVTAVVDGAESEESDEDCDRTYEEEGVNELSSAIRFYPNPVENELYLATELRVEEISIYDIYGRTVSQQDKKTTSLQVVDVADLEAGIYFVKIVTDEGEAVKRFIKN